MVPKDMDERIGAFLNMIALRNCDRGGYAVIVTGDETCVVWEPVNEITYDTKGTKRVKVLTTGKEKKTLTA